MRPRLWCVTIGLLLLALPPALALAASAEPVFGVATGEIDEPGSLTPLGNGRFAIQDRVYAGRSIGRSIVDEWAACFSGPLSTTEDWLLEAPRMAGVHQSVVSIRSERAVLTLRLRGQMEFPSASGTWEIQHATGACASLVGEGRYTASFSANSPGYRLTFEGQVRS
ncbi:MAG TPA: hypothetical protein VEQ11_00785 [Chloroflexota bacterium]|nr:hypothetical protein [Chloroflexota bacterium]